MHVDCVAKFVQIQRESLLFSSIYRRYITVMSLMLFTYYVVQQVRGIHTRAALQPTGLLNVHNMYGLN